MLYKGNVSKTMPSFQDNTILHFLAMEGKSKYL